MTIYCFHCKRPVGSKFIPYEDIELVHTLYYHIPCWQGAVRRNVIDEYVNLIMKVATQRRGKWIAPS